MSHANSPESTTEPPRLRSICVGGPREVEWRGDVVVTSIFKEPVSGRVRVNRLNLAGDEQSDLTVHGGPDKAIYAYPSEHYPYWHEQLPDFPIPWGAFGENLTTDGLIETEVRIGDRFRIGSAEVLVTQPRMPCYKLGVRFNRADMVKLFFKAGRPGFYLRVVQEGEVGAGDAITLIERSETSVSVADIVTLYTAPKVDEDLLRRAIDVPALPRGWRERFRQRLSLIAG